MGTQHSPADLRWLAAELQAIWAEESLRDDNPAKGCWSPDGLRELATMREQLPTLPTPPRGPIGAGLFDLRSLSTATLTALYDVGLCPDIPRGAEAETRFWAAARRILIERGAL